MIVGSALERISRPNVFGPKCLRPNVVDRSRMTLRALFTLHKALRKESIKHQERKDWQKYWCKQEFIRGFKDES